MSFIATVVSKGFAISRKPTAFKIDHSLIVHDVYKFRQGIKYRDQGNSPCYSFLLSRALKQTSLVK